MVLTDEERKQHKKESANKWRQKNREKVNEAQRRWHWKHREERRLDKKKWWIKNKEREKIKRKLKTIALKTEVIKAYSPEIKCANCGLDDLKNLTVDHLNGRGERHRRNSGLSGGHSFYYWLKKKNFPKGYQILCFGCNMEKGGRIG